MKRVLSLLLVCLILMVFSFPFWVSAEQPDSELLLSEEIEAQLSETEETDITEDLYQLLYDYFDSNNRFDAEPIDGELLETEDTEDRDFVATEIDVLFDIHSLLYENMVLGSSGEEPPPLHQIMPRSIITQANYPYTGGCFMAVNTNYGTGVIMLPETYKKDTIGFLKNTSRPVNLTAGQVSGYWIMGGTTYTLRIRSLAEPEYYYYNGSSWTWRTLTVSSMTDTNIEFLDETGKRGIENPDFSIYERMILLLLCVNIAVPIIGVFFRRS